jgi:peptidyl-prolyl cis-trans isomerase B (cyclophilin B)
MKRVALTVLVLALAAGTGASVEQAAAAGCVNVKRPAPKPARLMKKPTAPLPAGKRYTAEIVTNCGTFSILLDPKTSPKTVASFVALARAHFFDGTIFHRIAVGFVIQGGDPTQSGSGGPGYSVVDKPPANTRYVRGVVAMAKTSTDPPGTSGSQFFVVTGANVGLPPDYAILGRVVSGLPVVLRIGQLGDASEQPTRTVEIERVLIHTS